MSQTVENKVVEFQFNNTNFERNVKESMSTLDKLKEKLKFDGATKSFSDIEKAAKDFDISNVGKSADAVASNFNALEAIAVGALHKIGASAVELGQQLVNTLVLDQVSAGFDKYTKNTEAVATIMNATGESVEYVDDQLKELLVYTDKTSYSYSALVDNVSTLVAMGIPLQDAIETLEGIGNLNAFSGVSAQSEKAANNMYNLANAISMGALTLKQWRSVQKSIGTEEFKNQLIETAKAFGTLDEYSMTAQGHVVDALEGFDATLTDKWATADVLVATLQKFSDETTDIGQRSAIAASEAKTFADAVGAVKDALSTGWMQTYTTVLGNYTESAQLWTDLQDYFLDVLAPSMNKRNELLTDAMRNVSWKEMIAQMNEAGISVSQFKDAVVIAAREHGYAIDEIMADEKDFEEVLRILDLDSDTFASAIDKSGKGLIEYAAAVTATNDNLSDFEQIVRRVMSGELGEGQELVEALTAEGYNATAVMEEAGLRLNNLHYGLSTFSDEELEMIGITKEQRETLQQLADTVGDFNGPWNNLIKGLQKKSGRQLLLESLYNSFEAIRKVLETIKSAWDAIFAPITADDIYRIVESINEFTASLIISDETADKLQRTFEGVFAIFDIISDLVTTTFKVAFETISDLIGNVNIDVLGFTGAIGDNIVAFRDWLKENDYIRIGLEKVREVIVTVVKKIGDFIEKIKNLPIVKDTFEKIRGAVEGIVEQIRYWLSDTDTLESKWSSFKEKVIEVYEVIRDWAEKTAKTIGLDKAFGAIATAVGTAWTVIKNFFTGDPLGKIKELFTNFKGLNKIDLSGFGNTIKNVFGGVGGWIDTLKTKLGEFTSTLGLSFGKFGETLGGAFGKIWTFLKGIFEYIGEHPGTILSAIISGTLAVGILNISRAILNFTGVIKGFSSLMTGLGKAAAGYGSFKRSQGIANVINAITGLITALGTMVGLIAIISGYTDADIDKAMSVLWKMVALVGLLVVVNGLLTRPTGGNTDSSQTLFSKNNFININNNMSNIVGIVAAITAMTASLDTISKIPENRLKSSLLVLTIMVVELAGVSILLSKFPQTSSVGGAATIAAMGLSLSMIAGAIEKIAKIDNVALRKGLLTLSVLMTEMAGLALFSKGMSLGSGLGLLGMVLSIKLIIKAFEDIAALNYDTILKGLAFLLVLFGEFTVLGIAARIAGKNAWSMGVMAIGIGAALWLITDAMRKLSELNPDQLKQAGKSISLIIAAMTAIVVGSKWAGKNGASAGVMLLGMGASLILIAKAAEILGNMDEDKMWRATAAIDSLIGCMALVVAASKNTKGSVGTVVALAATIVVLILAIAALALAAEENEKGIIVATACIDSLMISFGLLVASTGLVKKANGTIILLALVMAALAAVLVYLTTSAGDIGVSLQAAEALSLLLLALSAALLILGKADELSKGVLKGAFALTAIIVVLAAAIAAISKWIGPIQISLEVAGALSILLVAMSAALFIMGQIKTVSESAMQGMIVLGVTVGLLMATLALINHYGADVQLSIETAAALSVLLIGMSAALAILSYIGPMAKGAMAGILALDILIADLILVVTGIAFAFEQFDFFSEERLQHGLDILTKLGEGLGKALGAFVGGVYEGVASTLPKIGEYLSGFMENATPFFDGLTSIGSDVVDTVGHLAAAILLLTAAELLSGISAFIGMPSMALFGSSLAELGPGLKEFASSMVGVDTSGLKNAAEAAEHLGKFMNSLPKEGGLWQDIIGTADMEGFATQIGPIGKGIKDFSDNVQGVDASAVEAAADAAGHLADLANNMVSRGGILQEFIGEKETLTTFGATLVPFAIDLKGFGYHAKDIDSKAIENAAESAGYLADLANNLRAHGGVVQEFIGDATLTSFGAEIMPFSNALVYVSNNASSMSSENIQKVATIGGKLSEMANSLQMHDGAINWFIGDNGLDDFASDLKKFASGLVDFSNTVSGNALDTEAIDKATTATQGLVDLSNSIGEGSSVFNNIQTLSDIGVDLYTLGDALFTYSSCIEGVTPDKIEETTNAVIKMCTMLKDIESVDADALKNFSKGIKAIGTSAVTDFLSAFNSAGETIEAEVIEFLTEVANSFGDNQELIAITFDDIMQNTLETVSDFSDKFSKLGEGILGDVKRGMEDNRDVLPNNFKSILNKTKETIIDFDFTELGENMIVQLRSGAGDYNPTLATKFMAVTNDAVNAVRGYYQSMYNAGAFLAQGLANGVLGNSSSVQKAAGTLTETYLVGETMRVIDANSPSKVGYKIGGWWDQGLASGITEFGHVVQSASEDVADDVVESTSDVISAINTVMSEGTDFDPVIVPVMDLSEIQNGTERINELLGDGSYTLAGAMNLSGSISRSMGQMQAVLNDNEVGKSEQVNTVNNSFTNNFTVQADDPYSFATQVSEIIQSQVERSNAVWA